MRERDVSDGEQDSVTVLLPQLRHHGDRKHPGYISVERLTRSVENRLGRDISMSYIQQIETGKRPPSAPVLEAIAEHFGLEPERFLEYRLARARRLLDEREVGPAAAAENYADMEAAFPGLAKVRQRLIESVTLTEADHAAQRIGERVRALVSAQDQDPGSTSGGDPQR